MNRQEIERCVKIVLEQTVSRHAPNLAIKPQVIDEMATLIMGYIQDYPVYSPLPITWTDTNSLYPTCTDDINPIRYDTSKISKESFNHP